MKHTYKRFIAALLAIVLAFSGVAFDNSSIKAAENVSVNKTSLFASDVIKKGQADNFVDGESNLEKSSLKVSQISNKDAAVLKKGKNSSNLSVNDKDIQIGMSVSKLKKLFGAPDRTDKTCYGFSYYVYNSDYSNLLMVAVDKKKVAGWYTDAESFSYDGLTEGMKFSAVKKKYSGVGSLDKSITVRKNDVNVTLYFDAIGTSKLLGIRVLSSKYSASKYTDKILKNISREVFDITNSYRAKNGLSEFKWSNVAAKTALKHSKDMAKNNYFDHTNLSGKGPSERMSDAGIEWSGCAENIIAGYRDASDAACGWYNSEGHRNNMLSDYTYLGVGFAYSKKTSFGVYGTQNFYSSWN